MDIIYGLISLCLLTEFFYIGRIWATNKATHYSGAMKLIAGIAGLIGSIVLFIMLRVASDSYDSQSLHFSNDRLILPTFGWALGDWVIGFTLIVGFVESIALIIIGAIGIGHQKGGDVKTVTGRATAANRAAELLHLGPHQTKALVYIFEYKSMTIEDFQLLCPEVDRPTLEKDLQSMVRLGLMVSKGDKFIIT
jgi:hypothetical protein